MIRKRYENDTKTISVDGNRFENGAKQYRFHLKTVYCGRGLRYRDFNVLSPRQIKIESLSNEDGNVNENVEKQWTKLQNTITARGNATTWPLFRRRL